MSDAPSTTGAINRSDLPVLPPAWRWVQFSEVCDRVSVGHVGPTTEFFSDAPDGVRFLRSQNVRPGKLELESALLITPDFHKKLKKSQLRAGDILFVRVGANRGDCCVVPSGVGELNCANIVFARPKSPTGFHAYFFQSDLGRSLLLSASVGAAQGVINTGSVASMPVPLPPLPIQQRIASILSAYDELIENSQRRIKILESMARALYREWFVHFRFPGHESVPRVPSPLGDIPQGWDVKKLSDLITHKRRATKPGSHLEGRRYVPIDCLPSKSLALLESTPIEEAQSSLQLFENGDILFGAMRPYFHKVVVAPFPGVTRTTCFVFKPAQPSWHAFATMTASDEATVAYANAHSQGATIPYAVWDGSLSEMPVVLPSTDVLQQFEIVVAPMLARLAQSFLALSNLRRTRDLLLPRLLSGQIDVEAMPA